MKLPPLGYSSSSMFFFPRMLQLVAENTALEDRLYYLDVGLTDSVIPLEVFMREVRRLARKQFVARATIKKICFRDSI